jgi:tetratricopeptide (TPR) repeat protein
MPLDLKATFGRGEALVAQGQWAAAADVFDQLLAAHPAHLPALLQASMVALRRGRYRQARDYCLGAHACGTDEPPLLLAVARQLMIFSEAQCVIACGTHPALLRSESAQLLAEMGVVLSAVGANEEALGLLDRAVSIEPTHAPSQYFRGNLKMFLGDFDAAEHALERCLALAPHFAQASWVLSSLRKQTAGRNHVDRITRQLAAARAGTQAEAYLGFALFNELHDLGRHSEAWSALQRGCRAKRGLIRYDHAASMALFGQIEAACDARFLAAAPPMDVDIEADAAPVPIFVLGLHRSGTTLLERILGGHSDVTDTGESYAFSAELKLAADRPWNGVLDAALVQRADDLDYADIGRRYLAANAWRARGRRFFTEKLPSNFLNIGFIARALPQARVIHMRRDLRDTCFSNLRTLFSEACGYSYRLDELADYARGYQRLAAHWDRCLPGRVLDVDYERLVQEPARVAADVFAYCGLEFEPAALAIEQRASAVTTASTAQMRGGIRTDRGQAWRPYEAELAPLFERLQSR